MTKIYERALAEEEAVARIQAIVLRLLDAKGVSKTELADRLGVKLPRISQLLAGDPRNISVRSAAAVLHALGERMEITCAGIHQADARADRRMD